MAINEKDKVEMAVQLLIDRIKKARRSVRISRTFAWTTIACFLIFIVATLYRGENSGWAIGLLVVAVFGIYQAARALKLARSKALAVSVFEKSLEEAYEKLSK